MVVSLRIADLAEAMKEALYDDRFSPEGRLKRNLEHGM